MIVSFDRRFVFIKGLKVGGSSLELYLSDVLEDGAIVAPANFDYPTFRPRNYRLAATGTEFTNHSGADEVRRGLGADVFDAMRCALIVRSPYEKIRSYFYFKLGHGFAEFTIDEAIADCSSERDRAVDETGVSLVTDLLFYEQLNADLARFFASVGVPFSGQLDVFAKSWQRKQFGHIPVDFSPAQRARVEDRFAFEFEAYRAAGHMGYLNPVGPRPDEAAPQA